MIVVSKATGLTILRRFRVALDTYADEVLSVNTCCATIKDEVRYQYVSAVKIFAYVMRAKSVKILINSTSEFFSTQIVGERNACA